MWSDIPVGWLWRLYYSCLICKYYLSFPIKPKGCRRVRWRDLQSNVQGVSTSPKKKIKREWSVRENGCHRRPGHRGNPEWAKMLRGDSAFAGRRFVPISIIQALQNEEKRDEPRYFVSQRWQTDAVHRPGHATTVLVVAQYKTQNPPNHLEDFFKFFNLQS